MKFLLDTHTFLFAITGPERLSSRLPPEPAYYYKHLREIGATVLPVDARHSFELIHPPLLHKDLLTVS